MADKPFDRTIIHPLEKPLSVDINQAQAQMDRALRATLYSLFAKRTSGTSDAGGPSSGFLGDSFRVVAASPASLFVTVKKGVGFLDDPADVPAAIDGILGLDDLSSYKPVVLSADSTFAVPTAPAGPNTRIDIIEVRVDRLTNNPLSRQILNPATGAFTPNAIDKSMSFSVDADVGTVTSPAASTAGLSYKTGVAANPGVAPSVTAGYVKLAEIRVASADTTISTNQIVDRRAMLTPGGVFHYSAQWTYDYNAGTPIITLEHMNAPPGVQIGAVAQGPGATRGEFEFYVVGGEIASGTMTCTVSPTTTPGIAEFMVAYPDAGEPRLITSLSGAEATECGTCTPAVEAAPTAAAMHNYVRSRYQTGATTNNTNVLLEDLRIVVSGTLYY